METQAPKRSPWAAQALLALDREGRYRDTCGLDLRLTRAFGFCQGVQVAVARATRAAEELAALDDPATERPRLYMTGEIIHNPRTNERLAEAGVTILPQGNGLGRLAVVRPHDWVIAPAFGITAAEEAELERIGCRVIDTTCGWVRRIWQAVRTFSEDGLTTVIHGKVEHEETRATASRVAGAFVIVRNLTETQALAAAIRRVPLSPDGSRFADTFSGKCSPGFDPEHDLGRLGLVNQTTMLSSETEAIGEILRRAVDASPAEGHFRMLDTLCPATQKRQDAVRELLAGGALDAFIVVGGFRSSNTAHLAGLGVGRVPTYHVEDAACLVSRDEIRHLPPGGHEAAVSRGWMPPAPCTVGVSAGASTPQSEIEGFWLRLIALYRGEVP
jgi:4-hydroxy-3-methylbut-2-enyl diphosphate reductase